MKIVVIDDQLANLEFFKSILMPRYEVEAFVDHEKALASIRDNAPDLVILDCVMPNVSGHQVLKNIKNLDPILPVVMISGYRIEDNLLQSMDQMVDDFIYKPVSPEELLARVQNKMMKAREKKQRNQFFDLCDGIIFDDINEVVAIDHHFFELKGKEYQLFKFLVNRQNQLVSREDIFNELWGETFVTSATLDTHLCQLRKKLAQYGDRIITRKNAGFLYSRTLMEV